MISAGRTVATRLHVHDRDLDHRRRKKKNSRGEEALRARGKKAAARLATGCARVTSVHISALWRELCELGKDGEERWQTIGECFFSICQKMKDEEG